MTRRRKLLAAALLALLLAGALEAASYALWWASEGEPFAYSAAAELRRRPGAAAGGDPLARGEALSGAAGLGGVEVHTAEVLHPFLGFVADRSLNAERRRRERPFLVDAQGFFQPPGRAGDGEPVRRVAVFGGSVAFVFSLVAAETFAGELERRGGAPRAVEVVSRALGGHKQPQQLMALSYALAVGERYDAAVNLDGFNELTLGEENRQRGLYPPFPRAWDLRVRRTTDLGHLAAIGEIAHLRRRRGERARRLDASPLRFSVTANLLWRAADRRLAGELAAARQRLNRERAGDLRQPDLAGPHAGDAPPATALAELVALWERSSRQMHAVAAAHGVAYHHVLQPNLMVPGSKPLSAAERRLLPPPDHPWRRQVEAGYPLLRRAGDRLTADGVAFHDLADLFADVEETVYVDDCCHLNERGNELLAAAIAREMSFRGGLFQPPSP